MIDVIKLLAPRIVQDLITALSVYLSAHGFITADQTQGFIGAAFFLVMLVVNGLIHMIRKENNLNDGYNQGLVAMQAPSKVSGEPK